MSQFVKYNKRSIKLPPGCKDLNDLSKSKGLRKVYGALPTARQPVVTREESVTGTLAEIAQHVATVSRSQLVYPISPLPPAAPLLSKLLTDLFQDLRGLNDKSQLQFRSLEIANAA